MGNIIIPVHNKPSLEIEHGEIAFGYEAVYSCTYFCTVQVEETTLAAALTSFILFVRRMIVGVTLSVPAGNASYVNTQTQKLIIISKAYLISPTNSLTSPKTEECTR